MPEIPVSITIPDMWGGDAFTRSNWGDITYLVGANGTGKSRFSEKLKEQILAAGYKPRILTAERLAGFERQSYHRFTEGQLNHGLNISSFQIYKSEGDNFGLSASAFVILKERLDLRVRIEAFLSDIFAKTIRFVEAGGYLNPKAQNLSGGGDYDIKSSECHGLKELITLLTFLFDPAKDCLILDEPELHLHPQYQSFLFSKIREVAGDPKVDPSRKLFFIITHSPYFLDFQTIGDLKSVVVFSQDKPPRYVSELSSDDEFILKRFLPRFNTHHKQFFFSSNPVFVEGYTDQQIISLLYEKTSRNIAASGSCVIDVGGKDELAVFFRLCENLGISPRIVADLDALLRGKLKQIVCKHVDANAYLRSEGVGADMQSEVGDLERKILDIANDLRDKETDDPEVSRLIEALNNLVDGNGEPSDGKLHEYRMKMLLAIQRHANQISAEVSEGTKAKVQLISGRIEKLFEAARRTGVFFLPLGELEHYYTQTAIDYLNVSDDQKSLAFQVERDYLLSATKDQVDRGYSELICWLSRAVPSVTVNLKDHLRFQLIEWIQAIQLAVERGEISTIDQLKVSGRINYSLFSQIAEVISFQLLDKKIFDCELRIAESLSPGANTLKFTQATTATDIELQ